MIALKSKSDIGDKINTQITQSLMDATARLARSDFPDFSDPNKLGDGQAMVDRLTNVIGILQKPELDFSENRADHDDILGDEGVRRVVLANGFQSQSPPWPAAFTFDAPSTARPLHRWPWHRCCSSVVRDYPRASRFKDPKASIIARLRSAFDRMRG